MKKNRKVSPLKAHVLLLVAVSDMTAKFGKFTSKDLIRFMDSEFDIYMSSHQAREALKDLRDLGIVYRRGNHWSYEVENTLFMDLSEATRAIYG